VPITLIVTTTTKSMLHSETPADAFSAHPDTALFPAPPATDAELTVRLERTLKLKAELEKDTSTDNVGSLGGFGAHDGAVRVSRTQPVWVPESGDHGRWRREVRFDTALVLDCTPTVELKNITCTVRRLFLMPPVLSADRRRRQYAIHVDIPFPGIGNNLKMNIPIDVNSGVGPFSQSAPRCSLPQ
jgi:hypothetical protein